MAILETKVRGEELSLSYEDILTSTLTDFLFSSHPKRKRDREAHFKIITLAPTTEEDNYRTTRLN